MERLTVKKKLGVVRLYFSGLSYDEIADKCGVSKGTVANVIAELKAGSFPEAADAAEQIELLRELSIDLKQSNLTPGQCGTGLVLLARISECGLEPADIDRWPMILKAVPTEDDAKEFIRLVYSIEEVQQRSGLGIDALEEKAHELEKKAADLEAVSDKLKDSKKELADLSKQRDGLTSSVAMLEQASELLTPQVRDLEKREQNLSRRIADMEPKAEKAETTLSTLKRETVKLEDAGFTLSGLVEFNEKLQQIAQHHSINPSEVRSRLLCELQTLDKGLELEALVRSRQQDLEKMEQMFVRSKKEAEAARTVVESLGQQKTNLETDIKETREKVSREIEKLVPLAEDTIGKLGEQLRCGGDEVLSEMRRLRDEAIEAGREVGRCEGILQSTEWLNELLALVRGERNIEGRRVKVIALLILRAVHIWLKHHDSISLALPILTVENLISELERWKV